MVAEELLSFVTKIRSGIGSLQFMIAGSGNRPSKLIFGGVSVVLVSGIEG